MTSGHAAFTVAGDEVDGAGGTIVFVRDPAARREAWAREAGTTVVAVGGRPGSAYRPRAWKLNPRGAGAVRRRRVRRGHETC